MVLAVLKVIGIVLLVLLGLVLFLVLLLLFAPFCYHIRGSYLEDAADADATIRWLGPVASFSFIYSQEKERKLQAVLKLCGIRIRDFLEEDGNEDTKESGADIPEANPDENGTSGVSTEESAGQKEKPLVISEDEKAKAAEAGNQSTPESQFTQEKEDTQEGQHSKEGEHSPDNPPGQQGQSASGTEKKSWQDRLKDKYTQTKTTVLGVIQMLQQKNEACAKLWNMYTAEKNQPALQLLKKKALQILKEIRPRKCEGWAHFGTGDPYSTSRAIQILTLLYPDWVDTIELIPDFNEEVHDVKADVKGRIFLVVILEAALRIFFNKRLRAMYKKTREIIQKELLDWDWHESSREDAGNI